MTFDASTVNHIARTLGIPASETFHLKPIGEVDGPCVVRCNCCDQPAGMGAMLIHRCPETHLHELRYVRQTVGGEPWREVVRREESALYVGRCAECGYVLVATKRAL